MRALITTIVGTLAPVSAFAASGVTEDSGIFVWIFLGFFAVIVVGQILPAIMLMTGLVKGLTSKTEVKADVKN